jgi:ParB/RepB/Spo0J family partition protein
MKEERIELAGLRYSSNRDYGGEGDIQILAEDIKRNGLINPITVKAIREGADAGCYDVIAGRRRLQAVTKLGWKDIPCRVLEGDEADRAEEIAGSENINRMAMHPLDEALIFHKLIESGRPIQELVKQYDRSVSAIWQRIQLLGLSDDIKALFRKGNLSLHAAAMLKSLDEKGQRDFYENFKCNYYVEEGKEIPVHEVRRYLSGRLNNRLFGFIVGKKCETCQKRTFYTDKELFPELENSDDSCLDSECYLKRWNALIAAKIKRCKKASPIHADSVILAVDGKLKKWLGKNPVFDGISYEIRSAGYAETTDEPGKNDVPCIRIEFTWQEKLQVSAQYWKHQTAPVRGQGSGFAPIVGLLELPEADAARAVQAFEARGDELDQWDVCHKVTEKIFWQLMEERAKRPPDKDEVAIFLMDYIFDPISRDKERIFEIFTGEKYSASVIPALARLPIEKLFFLMSALLFDDSRLPSPDYFDDNSKDENDFLAWLGISRNALKKIYQEEIRALMPKDKSLDRNGGRVN